MIFPFPPNKPSDEDLTHRPFEFKSERQKRIYNRLHELVSPGIADFFYDACRLEGERFPYRTTTHLIKHAFREIEGALLGVLITATEREELQSEDDNHKRKIIAILNALKIPTESETGKFWLEIPEKGLLYGYAHRRGLQLPRSTDDEFKNFWSGFEKLLDEVLHRFENRYISVYTKLDQLLLIENPTVENAKYVMESIPNNLAAHRYFFSNLSHIGWIRPLIKAGAYKFPPDEGHWPESNYLTRMVQTKINDTTIQQAIKEVFEVIPETPNEWIHSNLTECAISMPGDIATLWTEKEIIWVTEKKHLWTNLPYNLCDLIIHLANEGKTKQALNLAITLFNINPDPDFESKVKLEEELQQKGEEIFLPYHPEPTTRLDRYIYKELLEKCINVLVEVIGFDSFIWLCNLLAKANRFSIRLEENNDSSYIWRPSIENDERNYGFDFRDPLLVAARNVAEFIIHLKPDKFDKLIIWLEKDELFQWSVFKRLALYLIRVFPNTHKKYVSRYLLNKDLFESYYVEHEYWLLAQERFGELDPEAQQEVIEWILENGDGEREAFIKRYTKKNGKEPSPEEIEKFSYNWLSNALVPIKDYLPENVRKRYEEAIEVVGKKDSTRMPFQMETGFVGPTSPISSDDIFSMSVDELVQCIKNWTPPGNWNSPTRDGFAGVLEKVVSENPHKYISECMHFTELHPTYIRGFIEGFRLAVKNDRLTEWPQVLNLCKWIVEQERDFPQNILEQNIGEDREETNWNWTRKRIANLLEEGLKEKEHSEIPFELRGLVWSILEPLTNDPDPTGSEVEEGVQPFDAAAMSINTVRGQAMHDLMFYVMWVRRHIVKSKKVEQHTLNFNILPEVVKVLESHLDQQLETALTIRSVYGCWLPWLVTWDENWVRGNIRRIFPLTEQYQELWDTAWGTYIVYNDPYNNVYKLIKDEYQRALHRFGTIHIELSGAQSPDESLARHIMIFYGRSLIELEENSLLYEFFNLASPDLRKHALEFIGYELSGIVIPTAIERLQSLWKWRFKVAQGSDHLEDHAHEIATFGKWFASGKLEPRWAMDQLLAVLELIDRVEADEDMVKQLANFADYMPMETISAFKKMIDSKPEHRDMYLWQDPGKVLLRKVLYGDCSKAKEDAINLVNKLVAMGYLEYREVIDDI